MICVMAVNLCRITIVYMQQLNTYLILRCISGVLNIPGPYRAIRGQIEYYQNPIVSQRAVVFIAHIYDQLLCIVYWIGMIYGMKRVVYVKTIRPSYIATCFCIIWINSR